MGFFVTNAARNTSWPITVGAEGIAAAQFARCGFDVLVQAGRDKSWYDLVVSRAGSLLKISVKASDNAQWWLTNGFSRRAQDLAPNRIDAGSAVNMWLSSYGSRTVCCLVQFEGVALHEMPRIYLACPQEIAQCMRETAERSGQCALFERYDWTDAGGTAHIETLPESWRFSEERIQHLLDQQNTRPVPMIAAVRTNAEPDAGPIPPKREVVRHDAALSA
ncbi:MAG TPA: hypothetical protein VKB38_16155 [Terracidiphilus sp.]|nr:hypothetical protein [Terracidiphilus sp.]